MPPLDSYQEQRLRYLEERIDTAVGTLWEDFIEEIPEDMAKEAISTELFQSALHFLIKRMAILFTLVEFHAEREFLGRFQGEEEH